MAIGFCFNVNRFHAMAMLCWQFAIFFATQMLFPIFSMYVPRWRCLDPDLSGSNSSSQPAVFDKDCSVLLACEQKYIEYENDYFRSAAQEFDWACGPNSYLLYFYSQVQFGGVLAGTLLFGTLSDAFGRKPIACFVLSFGVLMLTLSGLSQNWQWLLATRFLVGLSIGGTVVVVCTYVMEMLLPEQRMALRAFINWGMARLAMTALCFVFPDWRQASYACALTSLPALLIIVFVFPESPTWLHSKGRIEQMRVSERQIAKFAGVKYEEVPHRPLTKNENFFQLIQDRAMLRRLFVLWTMWFTAAICGYSIDLHSSNLSGNLFLNQSLFSILMSLSKMILVIIDTKATWFSRRMLHQGAQSVVIVCFVILTGLVLTHQEHGVWILVVNLLGITFIEYTWDACYLCGVELPPTELRSTSMGSCSLVARIGAILAPSMAYLNTLWEPSAYITVVLLGSINLLVSYNWLVETKGINLDAVELHPDEVDAEKFGLDTAISKNSTNGNANEKTKMLPNVNEEKKDQN